MTESCDQSTVACRERLEKPANIPCPWRLLLVIAPLAVLAGGCASNESMPSLEEIQIDRLLDDIRDGAEPEEVKKCLFTRSYDNVKIVNERRLIFLGRGGKAWLNELRNPCTGLRRNDTLVFDLRGNSICDLDRVRGVDSIDIGTQMGAICTLGKFTQIPDWQVERVEQFLQKL